MKRILTVLAISIAGLAIFTASASADSANFIAPAAGAHVGVGHMINVKYTLPAAPTDAVILQFTRESVGLPVTTLTLSTQDTDVDFSFDFTNPAASSFVTSVTGPAITDGTYFVTLGYFNPGTSNYEETNHLNVVIDSTTKPAVVSSPTAGSTSKTLNLGYYVPENVAAGSVHVALTHTGSGTAACTLTLADPERDVEQTLTINPSNPAASAGVASASVGCAIPDGSYSVSYTYGDVYGNPVATVTVPNVGIDTVTETPTLVSPADADIFPNRVAVDYQLPEAAFAGSVKLIFVGGVTRTLTLSAESVGDHGFTFDPAAPLASSGVAAITGGSTIPNGTYDVKLQYNDLALNPNAQNNGTRTVIIGPGPDLTPPSKPTGLASSAVTQTSATLSWSPATDNTGVDHYVIYKDGQDLKSVSGTSTSVGLVCGVTSHFRVSAVDAAGNESAQSAAFDITGAACSVPPIAAPPVAKKCFAPVALKPVSGVTKVGKKKIKFSLKITATVAADGQSIKIATTKKNVQLYFKVDGKSSVTKSVTVKGAPAVVTVIYKPTGGVNKTIRIQLKQVSC